MLIKMIPTYIISLKDHKYKRDNLINQIKKQGQDKYEIIDAFDARNMNFQQFPNYKRNLRLNLYGKDLIGPEFGCYLSHKNIFQKIVNENIPYAIVLEDDAKLKDNFFFVIENLLKKYPELDLVRFLGKNKIDDKPKRDILKLVEGYNLVRLHGSPGGTYSYVISKSGAKKMLLKISNFKELMENEPANKLSIETRESIVMPLITIQQYALQIVKEIDKGLYDKNYKETFEKMITRSLYGNINASRNSA